MKESQFDLVCFKYTTSVLTIHTTGVKRFEINNSTHCLVEMLDKQRNVKFIRWIWGLVVETQARKNWVQFMVGKYNYEKKKYEIYQFMWKLNYNEFNNHKFKPMFVYSFYHKFQVILFCLNMAFWLKPRSMIEYKTRTVFFYLQI